LNTRTEVASTTPADVFVSIHVNSNLTRKVSGVEVYTLMDLNRVEKMEEQRRDNQRRLFGALQMDTADADVGEIVSDMLYDQKQVSSRALAADIMMRLSQIIKNNKPRAVKRSHFFVLRNTLIPAVLVEVGFISNPKEERLLKTAAHRQRIAQVVARSIMTYGKNQ
jgi:N-acetylmuramoyl-L-alanine amidase